MSPSILIWIYHISIEVWSLLLLLRSFASFAPFCSRCVPPLPTSSSRPLSRVWGSLWNFFSFLLHYLGSLSQDNGIGKKRKEKKKKKSKEKKEKNLKNYLIKSWLSRESWKERKERRGISLEFKVGFSMAGWLFFSILSFPLSRKLSLLYYYYPWQPSRLSPPVPAHQGDLSNGGEACHFLLGTWFFLNFLLNFLSFFSLFITDFFFLSLSFPFSRVTTPTSSLGTWSSREGGLRPGRDGFLSLTRGTRCSSTTRSHRFFFFPLVVMSGPSIPPVSFPPFPPALQDTVPKGVIHLEGYQVADGDEAIKKSYTISIYKEGFRFADT